MLDALDNVDWPNLQHAYGPAVDVPNCLRRLLSADEDTRSEALDELHGNIWHQGTVYEATAHAVPFLVELMDSPSTPSRASIAVLLGLIARGASYHAVHDPSQTAKLARELEWVRAARQAVRGHLECAMRLANDHDPQLRLGVVHLLACFPEDAPQTCPVVRSVLREMADAGGRAALGLALALLGELERSAFAPEGATALPLRRLEVVAEATIRGAIERSDALDILLDLATDSFEEERLEELID
jgi:hypothetical protein